MESIEEFAKGARETQEAGERETEREWKGGGSERRGDADATDTVSGACNKVNKEPVRQVDSPRSVQPHFYFLPPESLVAARRWKKKWGRGHHRTSFVDATLGTTRSLCTIILDIVRWLCNWRAPRTLIYTNSTTPADSFASPGWISPVPLISSTLFHPFVYISFHFSFFSIPFLFLCLLNTSLVALGGRCTRNKSDRVFYR